MGLKQFDLTPDPNVLVALTQTPLRQMDALCELVDNAIDSFSAARRQGISIDNPTIQIALPKESDIKNGIGCVCIIDNGPGLSADDAERALRAGYSSNNQYDNLGLFGMGFNISTGKMGSVTTLSTARIGDEDGIKVKIDLNEMNRNKSYLVSPETIEKPFEHGTKIEINGWWPEGNSNNGFIRGLARYSKSKVTEELGRRYASLLRDKKVQIIVNGITCESYEFCVWGANRHVIRKKYGEIPAYYDLDQVVFTQRKCSKCGTMLESFQHECPSCGGLEVRTIEERIRGWVGIQRFDSATEYGVDLIRNGRAIRIGEKTAFFEYVDEFNKTVKDYPIDGPFGRIVGEIHLDHVPVDFLKRDFQRSTPEWQRAMSYIRGESSLQPTQKDADKNQSPIFKLYQGYRKVRTAGTTDMYMGYWDTSSNSPHRISREVEEDFIKKFKNKEPGYYTDEKWWEKVEEADHAPVPKLPTCPNCGMQVLESDEECGFCGHLLKSKHCVKCSALIPLSAKVCPECGEAQEAEILKAWKCDICGKTNTSTATVCAGCGQPKGSENCLSLDYLKRNSNREDALSIEACSIQLPDGSTSATFKANVYAMNKAIISNITKESMPVFAVNGDTIGELEIFVDKMHRAFTSYHAIPEVLIATEIADRIKLMNASGHDIEKIEGVSNITWQIIEKYWKGTMEKDADSTAASVKSIFKTIRERLAMTIGSEAADYYNEMTEAQNQIMATNMINAGVDISTVNELKENGDYLLYVSDDFIVHLFNLNPSLFFDGNVWEENFDTIVAPDNLKALSQNQLKSQYSMCLDDLLAFRLLNTTDALFVRRTICSVEFLEKKVALDVS